MQTQILHQGFPPARPMSSPTFVSSPFSEASSASFPNEPSPVSDPQFDSMPDPELVYSASAQPLYSSHSDLPYDQEHDMYSYNPLVNVPWPNVLKKQQQHPQQLLHYPQHQQSQHNLSIYIPHNNHTQHSSVVIHSPVPQHHSNTGQLQQQQGCQTILDLDIDEWPSGKPLHF